MKKRVKTFSARFKADQELLETKVARLKLKICQIPEFRAVSSVKAAPCSEMRPEVCSLTNSGFINHTWENIIKSSKSK